MSLTEQHTKELFSRAYIHALGGAAKVNVEVNGAEFDYGIDGQFRPIEIMPDGRRVESGFPVAFQLKSSIDWEIKEGYVIYDLESKTYNDIVRTSPAAMRKILILLCLSKQVTSWFCETENELIMQHCCYWYHIKGEPTTNSSKVRIPIQRTNFLAAEELTHLIHRP